MSGPLLIKLVAGWSVCLMEQNDPALRWQATATRFHEFHSGSGIDEEMALRRLAAKCGFDPQAALTAFGI